MGKDSRIIRLFGETVVWSVFLIAVLLVVLSGGKILDPRIGIGDNSAVALVVTTGCWAILVAVLAKLAVGNWRHEVTAKRTLAVGVFAGILAWLVNTFVAETLAETPAALLVGLGTALGGVLANRIFPHRTPPQS